MAAELVGSAPPELKEQVRRRFTIGPVVVRDFWSRERSEMDIDRGPCIIVRLQLLSLYSLTFEKGQVRKITSPP